LASGLILVTTELTSVWFNSHSSARSIDFPLSSTEQALTPEERKKIETRLASYNIPLQILHMVAEQCGDHLDTSIAGSGMARQPKLPVLFERLNDKAILMLEQIFLECQDSLSEFRLAVFLSSKHGAMTHKFVMDEKVMGASGTACHFDVCIYSRNSGGLKAVGMQNNSAQRQPAGTKEIAEFLASVEDVKRANPGLQAAYYASSYGYDTAPSKKARKIKDTSEKIEIQFFEYGDKMYFENKSLSD
jgi:anion-transporting  ArsA/GET3 family ATPase